ncbi:DUF2637 domain-containing protein [Nocardia puris]|uniref:DUF2637 domain-containing protein n=1 Tax=Nocardia puris TaxID=208602 RepID=UPI002E24DBB2
MRTPEPTRSTSRAHTFFWTVLAAAAAVSITGNATQALLHESATIPAIAAIVAIIPPLALLAAVHGVSVLVRAHAGSRGSYFVAVAMTMFIAIGAFWLSFTALRALAVTAGVPAGEAWLWPLIIEGSMAQSTVALLTLAHHNAADVRTPRTPTPDDAVVSTPAAPRPPSGTVRTPRRVAVRLSSEQIDALAATLCARDPARRRDPALVTAALTYHYVEGWNATRIARAVNRSRSSISRILTEAAEHAAAGSGTE